MHNFKGHKRKKEKTNIRIEDIKNDKKFKI